MKPGSYLKIRDILEGILFCQILREEWGLNSELKISNIQEPLSNKEKELLENFREKQTKGLIQTLSDKDPGWAYSALVTLARLHTIEESIRIGSPVFYPVFRTIPPSFTKKIHKTRKRFNIFSKKHGPSFQWLEKKYPP